jgi:hypothetical protein
LAESYNLRQQLEARNMTTVAILPTTDPSGEKSYRAMSDDKPSGFGGDAPNVANATLTQSTETARRRMPEGL